MQKIISLIDELPTEDNDTKGDIYEYLLSKLAQSGTNGQFRTPRQIIEMMVELMQPKPEDTIIDPAMGTAGFLVQASEYLRKIIMIYLISIHLMITSIIQCFWQRYG